MKIKKFSKKTIIILSVIILILSSIVLFSSFKSKQKCSHCIHKEKYDNYPLQNEGQPEGYVNQDSTFMMFPIIDFQGSSGERITTIKMIYEDGHYCSTRSGFSFNLENTSFTVYTEPYMSCRITAFAKLTDEQINLLKKYKIKSINIVNLTTYHTYRYEISNHNYFINLLNNK